MIIKYYVVTLRQSDWPVFFLVQDVACRRSRQSICSSVRHGRTTKPGSQGSGVPVKLPSIGRVTSRCPFTPSPCPQSRERDGAVLRASSPARLFPGDEEGVKQASTQSSVVLAREAKAWRPRHCYYGMVSRKARRVNFNTPRLNIVAGADDFVQTSIPSMVSGAITLRLGEPRARVTIFEAGVDNR